VDPRIAPTRTIGQARAVLSREAFTAAGTSMAANRSADKHRRFEHRLEHRRPVRPPRRARTQPLRSWIRAAPLPYKQRSLPRRWPPSSLPAPRRGATSKRSSIRPSATQQTAGSPAWIARSIPSLSRTSSAARNGVGPRHCARSRSSSGRSHNTPAGASFLLDR